MSRHPPASSPRVASIDLIRGAVMVLMAIDHVRVFAGVSAGGTHVPIFFTRWITHFCAPAFIFFAGTSAYFYARRHAGLARFLVTRGLWLIFLELTLFRLAWTFNFDFMHYEMAGVIWVIGWSMIFLALLAKLPLGVIIAIALVIVAGHNLLDGYAAARNASALNSFADLIWRVLYGSFLGGASMFLPDGPMLIVLYSLIPWVGVMAAGYAFGSVLALDPAQRDRLCYRIGFGATALFVLLRGFNLYGDPNPWTREGELMPVLSFLNTTKYPASLCFLLMTLGPAIALIPWFERTRGRGAQFLSVFGRVPFFFYALHIPLIHALALVVSKLREGHVNSWLFANHPMGAAPPPDGYTWSLPVLYGVWAIAVALLYPACRWFAGVKARSQSPWLSYF